MQYPSVVKEPENGQFNFSDSTIMYMASIADELPAWGASPRLRDKKLREFIPKEPVFASALGSTIKRYVSLGWHLKGPKSTSARIQLQLQTVNKGRGWEDLWSHTLLDAFTQSNGAWQEVVRTDNNDPNSPWLTLNHLDTARCIRTGRSDYPIDYIDLNGDMHRMAAHQVLEYVEMPSANENARGLQYCVLDRMLIAAQIMRDLHVYKLEKIGGRRHRSIHIVSGVPKKMIDDALKTSQANATAEGLQQYIDPLILTTLVPTAPVGHQQIDLASLPDGFDEETTMRWYINQLALAFSGDYQDYAPLPGGNLGTAQQSQVLHLKSRGKGPANFIRSVEYKFNFFGIMPRNVSFAFGEQDSAESLELLDAAKRRAEERMLRLQSGEITVEIARQRAYDAGDLTEEEFNAMKLVDITPVMQTDGGAK